MVVTFECSPAIHVYGEKCKYKPRHPYVTHKNIIAARKVLRARGVEHPKIISK